MGRIEGVGSERSVSSSTEVRLRTCLLVSWQTKTTTNNNKGVDSSTAATLDNTVDSTAATQTTGAAPLDNRCRPTLQMHSTHRIC